MKYGVVLNYNTRNIGDDIQTYAAQKLLPKTDYYLDRENLKNLNIREPVKFICNGWYMDNPENWPPASNFIPLFISFHVTNSNNSYKTLITKEHYNYYKKFEPIGCRDTFTLNLFKSLGIDAYLSRCLTLTLKNPFSQYERGNEIIVVDPFMFYLNMKFKNNIIKNLVPKSLHKNIINFSHHQVPYKNIDKRMEYTERLVDRYAKAHLIITSRIHAALPALAMGTPVLFIDLGYDSVASRSRFGGLIDLFNTIDNTNLPFTDGNFFSRIYRKINLSSIYYPIKNFKFNWDNPPKPPESIQDISTKIKERVKVFIES